MTVPWTLEQELLDISGCSDLTEALRGIGMLTGADTLVQIETTDDWYRSGSETYLSTFTVTSSSGQCQKYVVKACVAFDGGTPLKEIFATWLARRRGLQGNGVSTPHLYGATGATLIEEYIQYDLCDAVRSATNRQEIVKEIGRTSALIANMGFLPISAHDWRSRGADAVLIDFGQDLGNPGVVSGTESGILSEVLNNLARSGVGLSESELQLIGSSYESALEI